MTCCTPTLHVFEQLVHYHDDEELMSTVDAYPEETVWGDTLQALAIQLFDEVTQTYSTVTAATISIWNADTGTLVVNAATASVATPTKPAWAQAWGSGANQIPDPSVPTSYLVRWRLTVGGLLKTSIAYRWVVVPFNPTLQ